MRTALLTIALLAGPALAETPPQHEADGYTRYELLAPESHKFRITYEITAATPGATAYYNPIRPGSAASDEAVFDRATGKPLRFEEVDGDTARAGGVRGAKSDERFIKVTLARPVPPDGGGGRIEIDKTYEDAPSYHGDGDTITFDRPLGVKKNAVVLPAGYVLVSCNYPSQVIRQADGRIAIAFWNVTPAQAPLVLTARKAMIGTAASAQHVEERAHQNRNIVYYLKPPETHAFALTHDYTETKAGTATYVNIVRAGSTVSEPSARDLDTGATLSYELVKGDAVKRAEPDAKDIDATTTAVVFHYPPIPQGGSRRLRFAETYTDPVRYTLVGDELVWHRAFGRADNAIVLPAGWELTNSSIPATVSRTPDNRVRLDFLNPRPDEIDVIVTARKAG
ncbi:hypothetical protein [Sphingomonas nostoxanthinifaciens]|uniref:hypothetical protein n=1 Tax=Sphingomonas nostoxanthinifaciens TaxID=2872652 RepID=UPI001CC20D51|nr:hypothetical protein [Sphingomonas nostoxanthinifaciens]UAK23522.1 hypothetical protein K8P63_14150 [Sphingomonas nostoxanthinifaciens]